MDSNKTLNISANKEHEETTTTPVVNDSGVFVNSPTDKHSTAKERTATSPIVEALKSCGPSSILPVVDPISCEENLLSGSKLPNGFETSIMQNHFIMWNVHKSYLALDSDKRYNEFWELLLPVFLNAFPETKMDVDKMKSIFSIITTSVEDAMLSFFSNPAHSKKEFPADIPKDFLQAKEVIQKKGNRDRIIAERNKKLRHFSTELFEFMILPNSKWESLSQRLSEVVIFHALAFRCLKFKYQNYSFKVNTQNSLKTTACSSVLQLFRIILTYSPIAESTIPPNGFFQRFITSRLQEELNHHSSKSILDEVFSEWNPGAIETWCPVLLDRCFKKIVENFSPLVKELLAFTLNSPTSQEEEIKLCTLSKPRTPIGSVQSLVDETLSTNNSSILSFPNFLIVVLRNDDPKRYVCDWQNNINFNYHDQNYRPVAVVAFSSNEQRFSSYCLQQGLWIGFEESETYYIEDKRNTMHKISKTARIILYKRWNMEDCVYYNEVGNYQDTSPIPIDSIHGAYLPSDISDCFLSFETQVVDNEGNNEKTVGNIMEIYYKMKKNLRKILVDYLVRYRNLEDIYCFDSEQDIMDRINVTKAPNVRVPVVSLETDYPDFVNAIPQNIGSLSINANFRSLLPRISEENFILFEKNWNKLLSPYYSSQLLIIRKIHEVTSVIRPIYNEFKNYLLTSCPLSFPFKEFFGTFTLEQVLFPKFKDYRFLNPPNRGPFKEPKAEPVWMSQLDNALKDDSTTVEEKIYLRDFICFPQNDQLTVIFFIMKIVFSARYTAANITENNFCGKNSIPRPQEIQSPFSLVNPFPFLYSLDLQEIWNIYKDEVLWKIIAQEEVAVLQCSWIKNLFVNTRGEYLRSTKVKKNAKKNILNAFHWHHGEKTETGYLRIVLPKTDKLPGDNSAHMLHRVLTESIFGVPLSRSIEIDHVTLLRSLNLVRALRPVWAPINAAINHNTKFNPNTGKEPMTISDIQQQLSRCLSTKKPKQSISNTIKDANNPIFTNLIEIHNLKAVSDLVTASKNLKAVSGHQFPDIDKNYRFLKRIEVSFTEEFKHYKVLLSEQCREEMTLESFMYLVQAPKNKSVSPLICTFPVIYFYSLYLQSLKLDKAIVIAVDLTSILELYQSNSAPKNEQLSECFRKVKSSVPNVKDIFSGESKIVFMVYTNHQPDLYPHYSAIIVYNNNSENGNQLFYYGNRNVENMVINASDKKETLVNVQTEPIMNALEQYIRYLLPNFPFSAEHFLQKYEENNFPTTKLRWKEGLETMWFALLIATSKRLYLLDDDQTCQYPRKILSLIAYWLIKKYLQPNLLVGISEANLLEIDDQEESAGSSANRKLSRDNNKNKSQQKNRAIKQSKITMKQADIPTEKSKTQSSTNAVSVDEENQMKITTNNSPAPTAFLNSTLDAFVTRTTSTKSVTKEKATNCKEQLQKKAQSISSLHVDQSIENISDNSTGSPDNESEMPENSQTTSKSTRSSLRIKSRKVTSSEQSSEGQAVVQKKKKKAAPRQENNRRSNQNRPNYKDNPADKLRLFKAILEVKTNLPSQSDRKKGDPTQKSIATDFGIAHRTFTNYLASYENKTKKDIEDLIIESEKELKEKDQS